MALPSVRLSLPGLPLPDRRSREQSRRQRDLVKTCRIVTPRSQAVWNATLRAIASRDDRDHSPRVELAPRRI